MDLLKTLLVYMTVLFTSAAQSAPSVTPAPAQPTVTPSTTATVTVDPSQSPSVSPAVTSTATATATITPSPTPYSILSKGDRGEEVKRLQRRLNELHYNAGTADGVFGKQTREAVIAFQKANGLKTDGVAGPATQKILYESTGVVTARPTATASPTPTVVPGPTAVPTTVNVPVYYVDQADNIIAQTVLTLYGTATVYAQASKVPQGYVLLTASAVKVIVNNGVADPASVIFRYQAPATPTATATATATAAPVTDAPATDAPATDTPAPVTDAPATDAPATDTPAPVTDAPATDTPAPETDTPAPATDTPAPATDAPATDTPAPATDTPAPATDAPATDTPAPVTDAPATDTPAPITPSPAPTLIPAGNSVTLNGETTVLKWFTDSSNRPYVMAKDFAEAAGLTFTVKNGTLSLTMNGHQAVIVHDGDTLTSLTVDDSQITDKKLLPRIESNEVYLPGKLLTHLGAVCEVSGGSLTITLP
ncbi:MAG: peptidoglycan-binding protein [Clostridiales bacterium]|nr:peptidoglycan-binding protein [Clostridiales bacterium]